MNHYYSQRKADCSNPIALAFDVNSKSNITLGIALRNPEGNIPYELVIKSNIAAGSVSEIIENSLNHSSNHEDNTFCGEKVIIEADESKSGIPFDINGNVTYYRPSLESRTDGYYNFNDSLSEAENGSLIFFLTDSPKTDNVIYSNLGTFEQKNEEAHSITPFVLEFENDNPILLDIDKDSISFLLLGHEVKRDFSKCLTTTYEKTVDGVTTTEYQTVSDILKPPYRARFVISNGGRMVSFSVYNKEKKVWDCVKSLVFDIEKLEGKWNVVFSTDSPDNIRNITANF